MQLLYRYHGITMIRYFDLYINNLMYRFYVNKKNKLFKGQLSYTSLVLWDVGFNLKKNYPYY